MQDLTAVIIVSSAVVLGQEIERGFMKESETVRTCFAVPEV